MPFLGKTPTKILDANVNIDGGNIDGTTIGADSAAAGTFTNLTATGTLTLPDDGISGDDVNGGTISNFASTGIDDNATSTAITIDSSENVSISPSGGIITLGANGHLTSKQSLDVATAGGRYIGASNRGTVGQIRIEQTTTSADGGYVSFDTCASGSTSPTERMRINSSGNVGIGTNSPSRLLHLKAADSCLLQLQVGNTTGNCQILFGDSGSTTAGKVLYNHTDNAMSFEANASERMRIDSSGNVLIGKTALGSSTAGTQIKPAGEVTITRGGNHVLVANRESNDGDIVLFQRSGSTVGSLGCNNSGGTPVLDISANSSSGIMRMLTSGSERVRIDSSGNVGIGTGSPSSYFSSKLVVNTTDDDGITIVSDTTGAGYLSFADGTSGNQRYRGYAGYDHSTDTFLYASHGDHRFYSGATTQEAMRIDSSGNVMVGTTSASGFLNSTSATGVINYQSGALGVSKSSDIAGYFKRLGNDGAIVEFRNSTATTVGAINTRANQLAIGCNGTGFEFNDSNDAIIPFSPNANNTRDNALDLGMSSVRFDDIYATNGTIQTSDINEKQDIETLSEAEQRVAVAAKALLRKFRWKSAIEEKGDEARIHFGIIAQDLQAAFEAEGLDAGEYGMFINTTWTDEETGEERSRMGVRYSELLAFIIAAI